MAPTVVTSAIKLFVAEQCRLSRVKAIMRGSAMHTLFEIFEAPEMVVLLLFALIAGSAALWLQTSLF
jgi:hypothetical protein